jgi:protein-L-isoaspartate(D-aspartate) O-methyltransferase
MADMRKDRDTALDALLQEIVTEVRDTQYLTGRASLSPQVMLALRQVPREAFVSEKQNAAAYLNLPLPIGYAQTISQPYIVALMTDMLEPGNDHIVLEIGTGSGYQAAILSQLVKHLYTMEVIDALAQQASDRLRRLDYRNVSVRTGDGNLGWPEHAPYDSIIVTAAAPRIPPALLEQLKPGGRLVIPVGTDHFSQDLWMIRKDSGGHLEEKNVLPVVFVPLIQQQDRS